MRRSIVAFTGFGLLLTSAAHALPPASGSKCGSGWVNNAGAMNCFIQGEDDQHGGASHPHYVACTAAGEIFCCVDDDHGNQNCEVQTKVVRATQAQWLRALVAAQKTQAAAREAKR